MTHNFLTLSEELAELAVKAVDYFDARGFAVVPEPSDLVFPESPALAITRDGIKTIVLVVSALDERAIDRWWAYGKVADQPTSVMFVVQGDVSALTIAHAATRLVGVIIWNGVQFVGVREAADLTANLVVPSLAGETHELRATLAPAFEKFTNGDFKNGFADASVCLENAAREYFKEGVRSSRIKTLGPTGKDTTPTELEIDKMPIGLLVSSFSSIVTRTAVDNTLLTGLATINPERIIVVHKKPADEAVLRGKIGRHLHVILNTMKAIA